MRDREARERLWEFKVRRERERERERERMWETLVLLYYRILHFLNIPTSFSPPPQPWVLWPVPTPPLFSPSFVALKYRFFVFCCWVYSDTLITINFETKVCQGSPELRKKNKRKNHNPCEELKILKFRYFFT